MDPYKEDPTLLGGLLESLRTGLAHSYGQVRDDLSSLLQGGYNPGTASRMFDVVGELPIGKMASKGNDLMSSIWGPIRTPQQKKAVGAMWRADPDAVRAIGTDPRRLVVSTPNTEQMRTFTEFGFDPKAAATYGTSGITVPPLTRRGIAPSGAIGGVNLPEVMLHEGQHFLNEPRIYNKNLSGTEAFGIYEQLASFLRPYAQDAAWDAARQAKNPKIALDEALAYLSGPSSRNPMWESSGKAIHEMLKMKPGKPGTTRGPALTTENISSAKQMAEAQLRQSLLDETSAAIAQMLGPKTGRNVLGPKLTPEELAMYNKMSKGSAAPDIPRPVSSPGALEAFEALRKKLGLPEVEGGVPPEFYGKKIPDRNISFNKFKGIVGEEEIPGIMKELRDRYTNRSTPMEKMRMRDSSMRLWNRAGPGPETADDFIRTAIDLGTQGMGGSEVPPVWGKAPLHNLRRSLYPDFKLAPGGGVFNENYSEQQRLSPEQLAAFGYTLTKGGVLEALMADKMKNNPRGRAPSNPNAMQNLKRLEEFVETAVRKKGK